MKRVLPIAALFAATSLPAAPASWAQGLGVSINPYLGFYGFDESSFEDAFENADLDSGAIWGVRLGLGGHDGLSLDLSYGRSSVDGEFDIEEFDREDMVIVGTPEECLQKLLRYEQAGVDQLLCYLNFGYLPHDAVMKSIELLGTRVIPELKKRGANRVAAGLEGQIAKAAKGPAKDWMAESQKIKELDGA